MSRATQIGAHRPQTRLIHPSKPVTMTATTTISILTLSRGGASQQQLRSLGSKQHPAPLVHRFCVLVVAGTASFTAVPHFQVSPTLCLSIPMHCEPYREVHDERAYRHTQVVPHYLSLCTAAIVNRDDELSSQSALSTYSSRWKSSKISFVIYLFGFMLT